jgi:cell division septation protein DedD
VLLVRFGGSADSVLVIGVANDAVLGRFASPWREDLPLVFPDGQVAALRGEDVITLSAQGFRATSVIPGGARDVWTVVQWNGFRRGRGEAPLRPSAARADTAAQRPEIAAEPPAAAPQSAASDSASRMDSTASRSDTGGRRTGRAADSLKRARADSVRRARADSAARRGGRPDSLRRQDAQTRPRNAPEGAGTLGERGSFVVQFAALKAEGPAAQLASGIKASGEKARVVVTTSNGVALYRVILGPFRSRADAERAGQATGRDYWVFEGGTN